jgi:hypothetical protein
MATYILNKDFTGYFGDLNSINALPPQIYFKKGDKITGIPTNKVFYGSGGGESANMQSGVYAKSDKHPTPIFIEMGSLTEYGTTAVINNDPLNVTKATPKKPVGEMKRYKVKEDIYGSVWGGQIAKVLRFKKGDIVESDEVNDGGIYAPPTYNASMGVAIDKVFIPLSKLTEITGSTNELSLDNTKLLQYAVIGLVLYIVFVK